MIVRLVVNLLLLQLCWASSAATTDTFVPRSKRGAAITFGHIASRPFQSTSSSSSNDCSLDTSSWLLASSSSSTSSQSQQIRLGASSINLGSYQEQLTVSSSVRHDGGTMSSQQRSRRQQTALLKESNNNKRLLASVATKPRASLRRRPTITKKKKSPATSDDNDNPSSATIEPEILDALVHPFVPKSIWSRLKGREFDQPGVIDKLVAMALQVVTTSDGSKNNEWITWKEHSNDDGISVHVGKFAANGNNVIDDYHGANLPLIKTQAIIPTRMTPAEMANLMLDSSRVSLYNKMSLGRKDIRSLLSSSKGITKICQNLAQPPISSKKIQSTTLMHARSLSDDDAAHLVVSRAVPTDDSDDDEEYSKTEILLGINLFESHGSDGLKMTCVTHVYSDALPAMLATRVGVSSAISFIKDIRFAAAGDDGSPSET